LITGFNKIFDILQKTGFMILYVLIFSINFIVIFICWVALK